LEGLNSPAARHYRPAGPGRTRVTGQIDLAALRAAKPDIDTTQGVATLRAPGVDLSIAPGAADYAVERSRLLVLLGRATVEGRPVSADELIARAGDLPLGGHFASVAIDCEAKSVQLRTDRFGVQPLCWSRDGANLCFSERADALPGKHKRLDPQALFNYGYFHAIPATRTVFQGVSRLEPSSELRFSGENTEFRTTWQPNFSRSRREPIEKLAARFLAELQEAVRQECDVENVGAFLSGGTDSSTVAGLLKAVTGRAPTFSIGFDAAGYDEMQYARIASKHFGTRHTEYYVTPQDLIDSIPLVASHFDQPFGNSSAVPAYLCARIARESGVEKLLAGDGGDELFGGNARYARQKVFAIWPALPAWLRAIAGRPLRSSPARRTPVLRKAASYIDQASVPMPARMETYNLLMRLGPRAVFSAALLELVDMEEPASLQVEVYSRTGSVHLVDSMLAYDWRFTLADNDLVKVRGAAELAGLAVGFPLLSDALVDLSLSIGPEDKVRGYALRHFFKKALAGFLPDAILTKKKHGFGLPVGPWLVSHARFRDFARQSVANLEQRGLLAMGLTQRLFGTHLSQHAGFHGEMVWILMMLEQWLVAHRPDFRLR